MSETTLKEAFHNRRPFITPHLENSEITACYAGKTYMPPKDLIKEYVKVIGKDLLKTILTLGTVKFKTSLVFPRFHFVLHQKDHETYLSGFTYGYADLIWGQKFNKETDDIAEKKFEIKASDIKRISKLEGLLKKDVLELELKSGETIYIKSDSQYEKAWNRYLDNQSGKSSPGVGGKMLQAYTNAYTKAAGIDNDEQQKNDG